MLDRREFLKQTAGAAVLLGAESRLGAAALMAQSPAPAKTKVIVARDATLQAESPSEARVLALLDKAILAATGRRDPVQAWRFIGYPHIYKNRVIGLKVDGSSGRGIATHAVLIRAICERLQQAGVSPGNIVIWDSNARNLEACGLKINTDHKGIRCFGSDVSGYEDHDDSWGSARVRLSKILTRECALVINVPILKDHNKAGVAFSMMNLCSASDRPVPLTNNGDPAVADFSCIPAVRDKTSISIGDALLALRWGTGGTSQPRLVSQRHHRRRRSRGRRSHRVADARPQARLRRPAHTTSRRPRAALHPHSRRHRAQSRHRRSQAHSSRRSLKSLAQSPGAASTANTKAGPQSCQALIYGFKSLFPNP